MTTGALASTAYRDALSPYRLVGSMSAVCNPYDNASFIKTLKVEEVYLSGFEGFAHAASRPPVFIEDVYNTRRMHSALRYLPPNRFETLLAQIGDLVCETNPVHPQGVIPTVGQVSVNANTY